MKEAWDKLADLTKRNARHVRKGWRLKDILGEQNLKDALGEMFELIQADTLNDHDIYEGHVALEELADVLGTLFCYAQKRGWTLEEIEEYLVFKLKARFEV